MATRVIQVPVDQELLKEPEDLSKRQHQTRAELIRQACRRYLRQVEADEMDRAYELGYVRFPECPMLGEAQVAVVGDSASVIKALREFRRGIKLDGMLLREMIEEGRKLGPFVPAARLSALAVVRLKVRFYRGEHRGSGEEVVVSLRPRRPLRLESGLCAIR